jgi:deoxyribonuclease V
MKLPRALHRWNVTPKRAIELQRVLAARVRITPLGSRPGLAAGADVAFTPDGARCIAGVVVWDVRGRAVVETTLATRRATFPYVPGLLSFREAPAVLAAVRKVRCAPEVFVFDGQGLAHPRRFGLASHVGVLMDRPSVGCAKSLLCGEYVEPGARRGAKRVLIHKDEPVGVVLRTRDGVKPVFVSVGHRVTVDDAVRVVLACGGGYRLPEPTRLAHQLVTRARKEFADG